MIDIEQATCQRCHKPIEIKEIGPNKREWCSPACKQAAYRERKKELHHNVMVDSEAQTRITELKLQVNAQQVTIHEQQIRVSKLVRENNALEKVIADLKEENTTDLEQELAFSQHNLAVSQEKLLQTSGHIQKLERQVEVQKQRLKESHESTEAQQRIAALEIEVQRLQERLNVEERFRTDVEVRHFKSWLRRRRLPQDADFLTLFLDDTRLPHHASRSMYIARLKQYGYSAEDITVFEETWKDMLFNQS